MPNRTLDLALVHGTEHKRVQIRSVEEYQPLHERHDCQNPGGRDDKPGSDVEAPHGYTPQYHQRQDRRDAIEQVAEPISECDLGPKLDECKEYERIQELGGT